MLETTIREEMQRSLAEGKPCGLSFEDKSSFTICPNGDVMIFDFEPITSMNSTRRIGPARATTWLEENRKTLSKIVDDAKNRGWKPDRPTRTSGHFITREVD